MQLIGRIALLILISSGANATECLAVKWPYSQDMSKVQIKDLQRANRNYLSYYLFYELSHPFKERVKGLSEKLLPFLLQTELNENKYYFYGALSVSADLGGKHPVVPLNEICELKKKIIRNPDSIKSIKKKSTKTK